MVSLRLPKPYYQSASSPNPSYKNTFMHEYNYLPIQGTSGVESMLVKGEGLEDLGHRTIKGTNFR